MRKPFTDDGPNQPLSLIIDCDDPFANRDSIGEGYNSGAGFELTTKPGTNRVCRAPMSWIAAQT